MTKEQLLKNDSTTHGWRSNSPKPTRLRATSTRGAIHGSDAHPARAPVRHVQPLPETRKCDTKVAGRGDRPLVATTVPIRREIFRCSIGGRTVGMSFPN